MNDVSKILANLSPEGKRALLAQLLRKKATVRSVGAPLAGALESPLSHGQRSLWFLYQLAPKSAAYNLMYSAHIRSTVDIPALERAAQALLNRHPILTATYTLQNGEPIQRFHARQKVHFEVIDASAWSEEQLKKRLFEEGECPFDLEQGPVLKIKLFTRSAQDYILLLTVHHIAVDFLALDLILDELCLLYAAERVGVPAPFPSASPQYTDYIRWQADMLAGPEGERLWAYWQQELAGELPRLNLPTDRPRPPIQTYRGASHSFKLSEELSRSLRMLANAEKATLYMVLLTAFQILLFRYTNQEDILVGTPTLGRSEAYLQKVIGHLVNPAVLRADLSGNPTFKELLSQVRRKVIGALEHQDFPFPLLVERLQPKRDASYSPLFQVMFIWDKPLEAENVEELHPRNDKAPLASIQTSHFGQVDVATRIAKERLRLEPFVLGQQGAPFDLTLTVFEVAGLLSADFRYNVDLFDTATLARMEKHLQTLLEGIVTHPQQRVLDLPLLTEAEQYQLLVEWNNTKSDYPEHMCVHRLIEQQVQLTPEAVAVMFEGEKLTYKELNRQANQLAHVLQALGVGPEVLVGVCMERSLEMVVALLGVLKAGGAYVPLDPAYPREQLNYMVQDAHVPVLLTQQRLVDRFPPRDSMQIICLDTNWQPNDIVEAGLAHTWGLPSDENPVSNVQPDNLVYMIYTSGSTGRPKGVMNIHRGLCNRLHWMQQAYRLTPADRVLQKTPFSFDVSVWEFFWPLLTGACLVVARPGGHQDPGYLVSLTVEQKITMLHFVPSMLQVFLMEHGLERCESLKRVICSGEALPFELQERFFSRLDAELHNLYGPTEASIDVTNWKCQRQSHQSLVPIGRPIANTQMYILDQALHPVPIGVPGELYIGGVGVARGYFNRPELTAEKFVPNPFIRSQWIALEAGTRLFKTGDLARYRPDGAVEFLGRIDHQVKLRGFRIELGEIETVLGLHPGIKEVVVVAREDIPSEKRLVAYLVAETDLSIEQLRTNLSEKLPYYMLPATYVFLNALPLTPNGKVDRKALPAPEMTRPKLEEAFVRPRNSTEKLLANIWAQVLGIDRVGIHDNYFDLGGASIQSLQIMTKANEAGLHLTPEMLFEHQTVAELADVATKDQSAQPDANSVGAGEALDGRRLEDDVALPSQPIQTSVGNTIIESIGVYLPPKVVSTQEILQNCATPIRFPLEQLTGISTRRMAGETEFSFDLAKKAVEHCLANSKYSPEDIDLLICGNISRFDGPNAHCTFEPSTSIRLQRQFGFTNALAFDISNACTGLFTAVYIVDAFLKAGLMRRGMVVSGEYITHLTQTAQKEIESYMDSRLACLTVGDAGAAMILEQASSKKVGFHELDLYTVSRYYDLCIARATDKPHGGAIMFTDAIRVSTVNMQQAVPFAANMLKRFGWSQDTVQHVIMHQTSKTTINDAAREINSYFGREVCHKRNVVNNITERGNTATTTQIVALVDSILSNNIQSGDNIVFGITGSGATIGAALYTLDDLPDRLRRRASGAWKPDKVKSADRKPVFLLPSTQRVRVESVGTLSKGVQVKRETLELARAASEKCLGASSYSRNDIDLLVYSGVYRDDFICEPAIAAMIAGILKLNDTIDSPEEKKTLAFDLFNGAVGFLNACYASIGMIRAKKVKNAMIVASEIENNRDVLPGELRGIEEIASAVVLDESPDGKSGFGNFVLQYFTSHIEACAAYTAHQDGKAYLHFQKDPCLESYYLECIPATVRELLGIEHLDISQIKIILPPQISSSFIAQLSDQMNLSKDKFVDIAHGRSDLFTSSVPYALQYVREQQLVKPGDIGLIISAGSGIQVGCATYYF